MSLLKLVPILLMLFGHSAQQQNDPLTEEDKNTMLKCHNDWRSKLAMGNITNKNGGNKMPKANNMRKVLWDDGLAKYATDWANKCSFSHSWNGWAGESWAANGGTFTNKDAFVDACNRWWNELDQFGFNPDLILTGDNFAGIGHWTQMAWAKTDRIGCGVAKNCPNTNWKTYVVCWYYEAGNYIGQPVYTAGEPCSKCNTADKCENGLCAPL
uniref:Putative effector protein n=1 Tax=Heterodera avenae TaxID=34510 RepID=A0A2L0VDL9_HETAV|nr:putative effector protein [Heterodera avenae]